MKALENQPMKTLETIRNKLGLSDYKMSQRLGLTQPGYIHTERKGKSLRIDVLCKLQRISGLTWAELGKMLERDALAIEKERKTLEK